MIWMTFLPWFSTIGITYLAIENESWIQSFATIEWSLFFIVSMFSMGLAITPTTFISLFSGYFLGINAIVPVILSYQVASMIGYGIAQYLNQDALEWIKNYYPRSKSILENVEQKQWLTTFFARISPVLPFGLMNVVLSIAGVKLGPFFFGGLIGMIPRTFLFVWLGSQASILIEALETNDQMIWLVLISVVGIFGLYQILKPKA